ncbi:MAG: NosD domain-containing protein [Candidatus Thorarchaeota archaeon]
MFSCFRFIDFKNQNYLFNINISNYSQPLIVNGNWDILLNAGVCTGSGTYKDPYIIKDYYINGGGSASCIEIRNSNSFFKIINCTLKNSQRYVNPYYHGGILLINVTNGMILNTTFVTNRGNGISLYESNNISIYNNEVDDNNNGIYLQNCHNNRIFNNNIKDNSYYGIMMYNCNKSTIKHNTVNNDHYGIYLHRSNKNLILNNTALNNDWFGIYVWNSHENLLSNNTVKSNLRAGMSLRHSKECIITNNLFLNNSEYGLMLVETSIYDLIFFNKFIDNDDNALDDCLHNQWDNGVIGNYWNDYESVYVPPATNDGFIWDIPYDINGYANSKDNYPLFVFREDLYPPIIKFEISNNFLNTTTPLETDKCLQINCSISDYSSIEWAYLCENSTRVYQNRSLLLGINKEWSYDLDISTLIRGSYVTFSFYALDSHKNLGINDNGGMNFTIRIGDFYPPIINFEISKEFLNNTSPFKTDKNIQINCSVTDYSPIEWVYLCENTTSLFQNHSMSKGLNSEWLYNLDISSLSEGDNFVFFFYAKDSYNNIGIKNNDGINYTVFYGDSDNDGMPNGWEILYNLDPIFDDSTDDNDGDELSNLKEFENNLNPLDNDTDNDKLPDGQEVEIYFTNPHNEDTDSDLYLDGEEVLFGTNPLDFNDPGIWKNDPFIIDDNSRGNYTWYELKSLPWCSGEGTFHEPFIIKNLIINANNSEFCLEIRNSNMNFKIINCSFSNAEFGIKLYQVSNAIISHNNITQLNGKDGLDGISHFHDGDDGTSSSGFFADKSYNITLYNNQISQIIGGRGGDGGNDGDGGYGGKAYGIYLLNSWNYTITGNYISDIQAGEAGSILAGDGRGSDGSNSYGLYLRNTFKISIKHNNFLSIVGSNGAYTRSQKGGDGGSGNGLWMKDTHNSTIISNNLANICGGNGGTSYIDDGGSGGSSFGMRSLTSFENKFLNNTISSVIGGLGMTPIGAIYGGYGGDGGIGYGFFLDSSYNNTIKGFIIYDIYGGNGGSASDSNYDDGKGADVYGVLLLDSIFNNITLNTIKWLYGGSGYVTGMSIGIILGTSNYNNVFENSLSFSDFCIIELVNCLNNTIRDNICTNIYDNIDNDFDNDGLLNWDEYIFYLTDPYDFDTDNDGMPDGWEVLNELNPLDDSDMNMDSDGDGLSNPVEFNYSTDPQDFDTDNDIMPDGWEVSNGLDPLDGSDQTGDLDRDGLSNLSEYYYCTNPRDSDSDNDGYSDGEEVTAGTDPNDSTSFPDSTTDIFPTLDLTIIIILFGTIGLVILNLIFIIVVRIIKSK